MGLVAFTHRAARAKNIAELGSSMLDLTGPLVGARGVGFYVFGGEKASAVHARGVPEPLLAAYEAVGRKHDPVLARVRRVHAPTAMSVASMRQLARQRRLPAAYMSLLDYAVGHHYLLAPVIVGGELAGTLNFARAEDRAFGAEELRIASALAIHVSTRLTALRAASRVDHTWEEVLTSRGLQVAELAARGMTTVEMGRMLGVSSNTVKKHLRTIYERLSVGSRAELATILAATRRRI